MDRPRRGELIHALGIDLAALRLQHHRQRKTATVTPAAGQLAWTHAQGIKRAAKLFVSESRPVCRSRSRRAPPAVIMG